MNDNNLVTPQQTQTTPSTSGEPAKKKSKGVIATMAILSVLTIAGIGVSVFALVDSNSKSNHISDLEKDIANKTQEINNCKSAADGTNDTNDKSDKSDSPTPGCSTNGVDFNAYATNLLNNIKSFEEENGFSSVYKADSVDIYHDNNRSWHHAYINKNAELMYNSGSMESSNVIAHDVLDMDFVHIGNGVNQYLFFVNKDGTISKTEDLYNLREGVAPSITNNVGGLTNIISIKEGGCGSGGCAIATDINGKVYLNVQ